MRSRAAAVFLGLGLTALDVHASDPEAPLGIAQFVNPARPPSYRVLTDVESGRVNLGQSIFNTKWVAHGLDGAGGLTRNEGLGPLYNAPACGSCHPGGARGLGPAGNGPAPPSLEIMLEVPGNTGAGDPVYGHVLNTAAVGKLAPEGTVSIRYSETYGYYYPDGIRWRLRTPRYDISRLSFGPLAPNTIIKPRVAPALFGVGLLEAIPDSALGVKDPHVGRFGWQGASLSVRDQTTRAFSREMGITSVDRPDDDCTAAESDCVQMARSAQRSPEVSEESLAALVAFEHNLAVPGSSAKPKNAALGSELFILIGCGECHRPRLPVELPTENGIHASGVIAAYTDLRGSGE